MGENDPNNEGDNDGALAYLCEKGIISLLVDIVLSRPPFGSSYFPPSSTSTTTNMNINTTNNTQQQPILDGSTWTSPVKIAAMNCISNVVKEATSRSSNSFLSRRSSRSSRRRRTRQAKIDETLYCILSNDHINRLLRDFLSQTLTISSSSSSIPTSSTNTTTKSSSSSSSSSSTSCKGKNSIRKQHTNKKWKWTEGALREMYIPFVKMLKHLTNALLINTDHLVHLFVNDDIMVVQQQQHQQDEDKETKKEEEEE